MGVGTNRGEHMSYPEADLLSITCPDTAYEDQVITLGITVKNIGEAGDIWGQIYDGDTMDVVKNWAVPLDADEQVYFNDTFSMPDKNWYLVFRVGHYENSTPVEDEQTTKTITLVALPTVTTQDATNIGSDNGTFHATLHGTITDTGGENCDRRGFEWGPSSGNYPQGYLYEGSFGTGAFSHVGSFQGTIYYRAKARNSAGWGYGSEKTFDPPVEPPDPPTNVQASDGTYTDKVVITWTKSDGATSYQVYRNGTPLGWVGDVAIFNDYGAGAPYISGGDADASDGDHEAYVFLCLFDTFANNGATHTYKVKARGAGGDSGYSGTNTGYRGHGSLQYQWYRSAGDSDGSYSYIPDAESSTYSDYNAPAPTVTPGTAGASDGTYTDYVRLTLAAESANVGAGRYYKCYLTATGCSAAWSSSNRGYRGVGSLTYQWRRSAADSDADYSDIIGATTDPYNDTGAPANGDGRWYYCRVSASGAASQDSTHNRGYREAAIEVVTMIGGPTGWTWETLEVGVTVAPITTDSGLTWGWGVVEISDTIPSGGPLSWVWYIIP